MMAVSGQWARVYRLGAPYRAEIVHARYIEHRFARHAHEHFVIGLVEEGVQQYTYRRARHITPAGQIFFVNGDEPHTGESATAGGYVYKTLCLDPDVFRRLSSDVTGVDALPYLRGEIVADPYLRDALRRLHAAVSRNAPAMHCEEQLLLIARRLVETHVERRNDAGPAGKDGAVVARVKVYLEEHYAEDVSLADLGTLTSRSPFHIARVFSKTIGLPPHAHLESVRIRHARGLLKSGMSVADTALAVGYPDQSHFTNRFRQLTGLTPGKYASRT